MTTYDQIKERLDTYDKLRRDTTDEAWRSNKVFWDNVESDLRWAMSQLALLQTSDGVGNDEDESQATSLV